MRLALALILVLESLALAGSAASAPHTARAPRHGLLIIAHTVQLPAGRAHATFAFRVHANAPDSARLVVPRGTAVKAQARSADRLMRLDIATRPWDPWQGGRGWSIGCRHYKRVDACVEAFEHCPLTDFRWRATVRKMSAAAAFVRIRFVFAR